MQYNLIYTHLFPYQLLYLKVYNIKNYIPSRHSILNPGVMVLLKLER